MNKNFSTSINEEDVHYTEGEKNSGADKRTVNVSWINPFDGKFFETKFEVEENERGIDKVINRFREFVYEQYKKNE